MKILAIAFLCVCCATSDVAAQRRFSTARNLRGQAAPDFHLPLYGPGAREELRGAVSSDSLRLSRLRGKIVFLNFWFTSCAPCVEENPVFERLSKQLGPEGVEFVGVVFGENLERIAKYMDKANLSFRQVIDTKSKVAHQYGTYAAPTTYVIDRAGVVRAQYTGGPLHDDDIMGMLERAGFKGKKPASRDRTAHGTR